MRTPTPEWPSTLSASNEPAEPDPQEFQVDGPDDDVSRLLNDPDCLALLDAIQDEPSTADELERRCTCSPFTIDLCLDALTEVGLLETRPRAEKGHRGQSTSPDQVEYAFVLDLSFEPV
ncbi:MAG: hypothetical protein ACOC8O_00385 [Natronomonas sp.]